MNDSKRPDDLGGQIGQEVRRTLDEVATALSDAAKDVRRELSENENIRSTARDIGAAARQGLDAMRETVNGMREGFFDAQRASAGKSALREQKQALKLLKAKEKKRLKKKKDYAKKAKSAGESAAGQAFVFAIMGALAQASMVDGDEVAGTAILGIIALAFLVGAVTSFLQWRAMRSIAAYERVLGDRAYCTVEELAAMTGKSVRDVKKRLRKLISDGKYEDVYLSPDATRLFASETAYRLYMAHESERAAMPAPAPAVQTVQAEPEEEADEAAQPSVLDDCRAFLRDLRVQQRAITDGGMLDRTQRIESETQSILAWLEKHPEGAGQIRRFASYYMPTTLKLLATYNEVSPQAGSSTVAAEIVENIREILGTVETAFKNLQNNLLKDTALDVSAEISALETVLAQDGLTQTGFSLRGERLSM